MDKTQVCGDLFNRLFSIHTSSPHLQVDYELWLRIFESVPTDYTLPDWTILQALNSDE